MAIVMLRILCKLTEKMERIENYKKAIQQIQEIARFVPQGEVLYCEELDGDPFAEHHEEEEEPSPDETVADGEAEDPLNAMGLTSAGSINGDVEAVGIRWVLQAEGAHGAADGD